MPVLQNKRGNSILLLTVLGAVLLVAGVISVEVANRYFSRQSRIRAESATSRKNLNVLIAVAQRFQYVGGRPPIWYPSIYPAAEQIATERPALAVSQSGNFSPSSQVPNRIDVLVDADKALYRTYRYDLDVTQVSSLERLADMDQDNAGKPTQNQKAILASYEIENLSAVEAEQMLLSPTSSWPMQGGNPAGKTLNLVSFLNYIPDPTYPALISEVLVSVQPMQIQQMGERVILVPTQTTATTASIRMDSPPTPVCQLQLAAGQTPPVDSGSLVRFEVWCDSIAQSGTATGDGGASFISFPTQSGQSVQNYGTMTLVGTFTLTAPADPLPGTFINGAKTWTVDATMAGVKSDGLSDCSLNVLVKNPIPPAPVCNLTASPAAVGRGLTTTLTLACQNPVTTATIAGTPVAFDAQTGTATLQYKKIANGLISLTAQATGPGGTNQSSVSIGVGTCRFNDSNHEEYYTAPWNEQFLVSHGPVRNIIYSEFDTTITIGATRFSPARSGPAHRKIYYAYGAGDFSGNCLGQNYCLAAGHIDETLGINGFSYSYYYFGSRLYLTYDKPESEACELTYINGRQYGCYIHGTQIKMADDSLKPVQELREGDWVRAALTGRMVRIGRPSAGPEPKALWRLKIGNHTLRVTEDHPFLTRRGILRADHLKRTDQVKFPGEWRKINSIEKEKHLAEASVWNFEIDSKDPNDHYVFANGIVAGDLVVQKSLKKNLP